MNPNAMRVLEKNGSRRSATRGPTSRARRAAAGRLLATRDYRPLYDSGKLAPGALVHRAHRWMFFTAACRPARSRSVFNEKHPGAPSGPCRRRRRHSFAGAARPLRRLQAPLHGLPLAPPGDGQRRRRALLHRVPRPRPAHRRRADLEKRIYVWTTFNSRKENLQAPTWPARFRNSPTSRCGACSPRCRRRSR